MHVLLLTSWRTCVKYALKWRRWPTWKRSTRHVAQQLLPKVAICGSASQSRRRTKSRGSVDVQCSVHRRRRRRQPPAACFITAQKRRVVRLHTTWRVLCRQYQDLSRTSRSNVHSSLATARWRHTPDVTSRRHCRTRKWVAVCVRTWKPSIEAHHTSVVKRLLLELLMMRLYCRSIQPTTGKGHQSGTNLPSAPI